MRTKVGNSLFELGLVLLLNLDLLELLLIAVVLSFDVEKILNLLNFYQNLFSADVLDCHLHKIRQLNIEFRVAFRYDTLVLFKYLLKFD